jgi:tetratricopeptide (TPR) repeat protein
MSARFWIDGLKQNWYLLAALAVCFGAVGFKVVSPTPDPAPAEARAALAARQGAAAMANNGLKALQDARKTPADRAREVIASHQARLEEDPEAEEAPALLTAMGNLHIQKLGDYEEAIQCYEKVLASHPSAPSARSARIHLAASYEHLGDRENAERIYRQMMTVYPEDSQEYKYAETMIFKGTDVEAREK